MCNAWNHSPSCTCGWGGIGHMGHRGQSVQNVTYFDSGYWRIHSITKSFESYVNPNAICPICGSTVFFYQSPEGGRVFFDELGPPWPKHPCTDNKAEPTACNTNAPDVVKPEFQWQINGWAPFIIETVRVHQANVMEIRGKYKEKGLILYTQVYAKPFDGHQEEVEESIAYIRESSQQEDGKYPIVVNYNLSLLNACGETTTTDASNSSEQYLRDIKQSKTKKYKQITREDKKSSANSTKAKFNKPHYSDQHKRAIKDSAIALAFEKAKKNNR